MPDFEEIAEDLDDLGPVAKIIVIGVGGAGNNAVNRMVDENINNVDFYVMNTDKQALSTSKAPHRIVLGGDRTRGLGAGGDPEVGKIAAEESIEQIKSIVKGADMVFLAAGMGKGTGTGATPVIAKAAKEAGALTVAIVTRPFTFEGKTNLNNSIKGLQALKENTDALMIVSNDNLLMECGNNDVNKAFSESDRVLAQSVKTVTDIILIPSMINLDYADVKNTLKDGGIALIGFGQGSGPNKVEDAAESAISGRLLETGIAGARKAVCNVTVGSGVTLYEATSCVEKIKERAGVGIDIKQGVSLNDQLHDTILVSVIASDYEEQLDVSKQPGEPVGIIQKNELKPSDLTSIVSTVKAEDKAEESEDEALKALFSPSFLK